MSFLSSIFSGSQPNQPSAPSFQADPLVNQTDTELNNFGTNALQGILPTQYQSLLQTNSPQFQAMLNNSNAQIQGSAMSTAAMQGNARSGAAQAGATQAIASNTANLSYSDLLNTQLNQKSILGTGINAIQAANQGALGNQGQINSFASNIFGTEAQEYGQNLNYNANMANLSANVASQLMQGTGSLIANSPYFQPGNGVGSVGGGLSITGAGAGALGSDAAAGGVAGSLSPSMLSLLAV